MSQSEQHWPGWLGALGQDLSSVGGAVRQVLGPCNENAFTNVYTEVGRWS